MQKSINSTVNLLIKKDKLREIWLYLLFVSFAYEKPLYFLTNMDRVNPRLFDVVAFLGILFFGSDLLKKNKLPRPIMYWKWLVIWFSFCAIIWFSLFLPFEIGLFSLFFAYRYLLGLFVIYFCWNIKITTRIKKNIYTIIIFSGIFVGIYSVFELLNPVLTVEIAPGKFVNKFGLSIFGPFSVTYFHIAQFSGLAFVFSMVFALNRKYLVHKIIYIIISLFISWPLFFCGSRTALAYFGVGLVLIFVFNRKLIKRALYPVLLMIIVLFSYGINTSKYLNIENSLTLQRIANSKKQSSNSLENRISLWEIDYSNYMHSGLSMPFIGSGFYVAPVNGNYRISYGIHNIYLFIIEQSGIIGFILFCLFIITMLRRQKLIMKTAKDKIDKDFAFSAFVFFTTTLILGIVGQIFWRGFTTNNMNSYILMTLLISIMVKKDAKTQ